MRSRRNCSFEAFRTMIAFGFIIGIISPIVVDSFVEWMPGMKKLLIIPCLVASLLVGASTFAITRVVWSRRTKTMFAYTGF